MRSGESTFETRTSGFPDAFLFTRALPFDWCFTRTRVHLTENSKQVFPVFQELMLLLNLLAGPARMHMPPFEWVETVEILNCLLRRACWHLIVIINSCVCVY